MSRRIVPALVALALFDLLGGALLVGWPGAWQEAAHPLAMGTVFYPVQRHGALWIARGGLALAAARRPTPLRLAALAGAWLVEVPGALLLAWRTVGTGPGPWAYAALALVACGAGGILWRTARRTAAATGGEPDEERT